MEKIKCKSCGSVCLRSEDGTLVCNYCRVTYIVDSNATNNSGKPSKLDIANHWVNVFFEDGPGAVFHGTETGFDAVIQYFSEAEADGAKEPEYSLSLSRFVVKGRLKEIESGTRPLKDKQKFKDYYKFLINAALLHAPENQKQEIIKEREETLAMLEVELAKHKEVKEKKRKKTLTEKWLGMFGMGDIMGDYQDIMKESMQEYENMMKDIMKGHKDI